MTSVERIPFRKYVLNECERQWNECQAQEGCGSWQIQTAAQQKAFFEDMYQHLWPDRFELDAVDLPDEPEQNAWRLLTGVKLYSELAEGDKVWWYGYKGMVHDIRATHICEAGPHKGERVYRFRVDLEPSSDHIENTIYNGGVYGGVESLTVAMRD